RRHPAGWPAARTTPASQRLPPITRCEFRLFPFRSPLLREWFLFLGLLRCFSSAGALCRAYVFSPECLEISPGGLPHSGIPGLTFALNYPRLIAEFYALHRLLVPRHPPCALCSLTHLSSLLNADGRRVAANGPSSRGRLRVSCIGYPKSLSSLFDFEGTCRGAGPGIH